MPGLSVQELRQDTAGIEQSVAYIHSLIQAEVDAGTPSERIVVGGFSQGGAKPLRSLAPPACSPTLWAVMLAKPDSSRLSCRSACAAAAWPGASERADGGRVTGGGW